MEKFFNEINIIYGCLTALFTYMFGELWFLFVGFLILNITDWFTGWGASRKENTESSAVGAKGIIKKVCYWVVIAKGLDVTSNLVDKIGGESVEQRDNESTIK